MELISGKKQTVIDELIEGFEKLHIDAGVSECIELLETYGREKHKQEQERLLIDYFLFLESKGLIVERVECSKTIIEFEKHTTLTPTNN